MSVRIKSAQNGQYMTCPDGISDNSLVYCQPGTPLEFDFQGTLSSGTFRVAGTGFFLSFRKITGAVKLYSDSADAFFQVQKMGTVYALQDLAYADYMWLSGGVEPYITSHGDPRDTDSQWIIEGLENRP